MSATADCAQSGAHPAPRDGLERGYLARDSLAISVPRELANPRIIAERFSNFSSARIAIESGVAPRVARDLSIDPPLDIAVTSLREELRMNRRMQDAISPRQPGPGAGGEWNALAARIRGWALLATTLHLHELSQDGRTFDAPAEPGPCAAPGRPEDAA